MMRCPDEFCRMDFDAPEHTPEECERRRRAGIDALVRLANSGEPIFTTRPSMVEQIRHALKEPRR